MFETVDPVSEEMPKPPFSCTVFREMVAPPSKEPSPSTSIPSLAFRAEVQFLQDALPDGVQQSISFRRAEADGALAFYSHEEELNQFSSLLRWVAENEASSLSRRLRGDACCSSHVCSTTRPTSRTC